MTNGNIYRRNKEALSMTKKIDEMSKQIKTWLAEEGMYKDKVADDKTYFHFIGESPQSSGQLFELFQPKNREDLIVIIRDLIISPEHLEKLREMDAIERNEFLWDIKFGLLFRKSSFNMTPDVDNPSKIDFRREIYYDGLNKNKLMEAIKENYLCSLFVKWKLMERFGKAVSGTEPSPMFG
jgi:hypothetical protein